MVNELPNIAYWLRFGPKPSTYVRVPGVVARLLVKYRLVEAAYITPSIPALSTYGVAWRGGTGGYLIALRKRSPEESTND